MNTSLQRLLLIEDDPELGAMTAELLSDQFDVDWVQDGEAGLRNVLARRFAVIIVDRRLPHRDGVSITAAIRRAGVNAPVLMLTALGETDDIVTGLDAGANDYMVKPYRIEELQARLRALIRSFSTTLRHREIGDWVYVPDQSVIINPSEERIMLTHAENRLLDVLSSEPERAHTREQLRADVFTDHDSLGLVDTYVHYLRRKTTPGLVQTVRGIGYRLGNPHD